MKQLSNMKKNVFQERGCLKRGGGVLSRGFILKRPKNVQNVYGFRNNKNVMGACFLGSTTGRFALKK